MLHFVHPQNFAEIAQSYLEVGYGYESLAIWLPSPRWIIQNLTFITPNSYFRRDFFLHTKVVPVTIWWFFIQIRRYDDLENGGHPQYWICYDAIATALYSNGLPVEGAYESALSSPSAFKKFGSRVPGHALFECPWKPCMSNLKSVALNVFRPNCLIDLFKDEQSDENGISANSLRQLRLSSFCGWESPHGCSRGADRGPRAPLWD